MADLGRGILAIGYGSLLNFIPYFFVMSEIRVPETLLNIMFWNVFLFSKLGQGVPDAHKADGTPIFWGDTQAWLAVVGWLSGFIIYPIAIFLVLTLIDRLKQKNG